MHLKRVRVVSLRLGILVLPLLERAEAIEGVAHLDLVSRQLAQLQRGEQGVT